MKTTLAVALFLIATIKTFLAIKQKPGNIRKLRLRAKNIQYQLTGNVRQFARKEMEKNYKDALADHLTEKVMFALVIAESLVYLAASYFLIF